MEIDRFAALSLLDAPVVAHEAEAAGYGALWTTENRHDPFLSLVRAADATSTMTLGTGVAIAFARTPMTVAYPAYALAQLSGGRFVLGLGSQVRGHIANRFSMPWSAPAERMHEFVLALRAIFGAWQNGEPLNFRGEHYKHTLMNENFAPERHEFGPPPIYLAGVGPKMTAVAGAVADGFLGHPFTSPSYLSAVTLPALHAHARRPVVVHSAFVILGTTADALAEGELAVRKRIGFYAATPAYAPVLEHHGLGDLQPQADALARAQRWDELTRLVPDELVDLFAVRGDPTEVADQLHDRYDHLVDRLGLNLQVSSPSDQIAAVLVNLQAR